MSWAELRKTLGEWVSHMPASDEEHEARLEARKAHGEEVQYANRPNYCGGWDRWSRQKNQESDMLEVVKVRQPTGKGAACWETPTPGTGQCSSCRSRERESFDKYQTWLKGQRGGETATKAGRYMPKGMS